MKKHNTLIMSIMTACALLASCGDTETDKSPSANQINGSLAASPGAVSADSPRLEIVDVDQARMGLFNYGGLAPVKLSISFQDPQDDVAQLHIEDTASGQVESIDVIADTSDSPFTAITYVTSMEDATISKNLWLTDKAGHSSNVETISIVVAARSGSAPHIETLEPQMIQIGSIAGSSPSSGSNILSLQGIDEDADVAYVQIGLTAASKTPTHIDDIELIFEQDLSLINTSFGFNIAVTSSKDLKPGDYNAKVYLIDSKGNVSNQVNERIVVE